MTYALAFIIGALLGTIFQRWQLRRLRKTLRDTTDRANQAEFLLEQAGRREN